MRERLGRIDDAGLTTWESGVSNIFDVQVIHVEVFKCHNSMVSRNPIRSERTKLEVSIDGRRLVTFNVYLTCILKPRRMGHHHWFLMRLLHNPAVTNNGRWVVFGCFRRSRHAEIECLRPWWLIYGESEAIPVHQEEYWSTLGMFTSLIVHIACSPMSSWQRRAWSWWRGVRYEFFFCVSLQGCLPWGRCISPDTTAWLFWGNYTTLERHWVWWRTSWQVSSK